MKVDNNSVADSGFHARYGPLSVDRDDRPLVKAIRVSVCPSHIEVVCNRVCVNQGEKGDNAP